MNFMTEALLWKMIKKKLFFEWNFPDAIFTLPHLQKQILANFVSLLSIQHRKCMQEWPLLSASGRGAGAQ